MSSPIKHRKNISHYKNKQFHIQGIYV